MFSVPWTLSMTGDWHQSQICLFQQGDYWNKGQDDLSWVQNKERITEHANGSVPVKSTTITKQHSDVLHGMENLLTVWIKDQNQNQRQIPITLTTI
jgi:hypothetical protein